MGDWTSLTYVISQEFVIVAYLFFATSYFIKRRTTILFLILAGNIASIIAFIMLSAWVGVGTISVAIIRSITQYLLDRKKSEEELKTITKLDTGLLFVWIILPTIITIFTNEGFWTWFALFAMVTFTISIWQKNVLTYRILGIFASLCGIVYHFVSSNLMGIILESVLLVAVTIGLILFLKQRNKEAKKLELEADIKLKIGRDSASINV